MKVLFLISCLVLCLGAYATKPCPPSPCFVEGKFNQNVCLEKSEWVAIGRINQIVDDQVGNPINKNLSRFVLNIETWKKNPHDYPDALKFKVGWCNNSKELPKDSKGLFIFYGKKGFDAKPEYYWFSKV
ncbi:hypothetical protein OO007_19745 [Cocleimonas sp. KMM 6892]|uniref:hypothetical protein n=1 Tax=unclassified Cocleimonas TaxID=2639732 RepID=UPI002DB70BA3|nr:MULTISPECIES: hypothetical protein [unclassified Cocleimonas]MEB8434481.1 hypothetical protein [Cocleimonas sp. KMM 6892]MEC4717374.1 hypothetical protein [Cocleimonas sp. KMM 6895]MEC4746753.1 hypothetical protein [Cocleimonas sp. KMM 6896]